jgi:uncharacterized membrane protein YdcZ (DUF606 family)
VKILAKEQKVEIFFVGLWVICAFIAYGQAKKKNLNAPLWAVIGLVFGVFGVIASMIVKPK